MSQGCLGGTPEILRRCPEELVWPRRFSFNTVALLVCECVMCVNVGAADTRSTSLLKAVVAIRQPCEDILRWGVNEATRRDGLLDWL